MENRKFKIWMFFSSLLNMISKKRVVKNIITGRHFTNDIKWIKRKHLFRYTLDPNDRTLTIKVKNTTAVKKEVTLFSGMTDPYNRNNPGIEITVLENSYEALKVNLLSTTFYINKMKVITQNREQFQNIIRIESHSPCGSIFGRNFLPETCIEQSQVLQTIIELESSYVLLKLNKSIVFKFDINPNEEIIFVMVAFAIKCSDDFKFTLIDKYSNERAEF